MHIPKKIYFILGVMAGAVFLGDAGGDLIVSTAGAAVSGVGQMMNMSAEGFGNASDMFN